MAANVYPRAFSIYMDYPLDGVASCTFQQEIVAEVDGKIIRQPVGEIKVDYDPNNETMLQVYTLLRDFYLNLIGINEDGTPIVRDEPELPEPEAPPAPVETDPEPEEPETPDPEVPGEEQ